MGLDQYLYKTDIPKEVWDICFNYEGAIKRMFDGFSHLCDNEKYCFYLRKNYVVDDLLHEYATIKTFDCVYYYIDKVNAIKILEHIIRALKLIPIFYDMDEKELFKMTENHFMDTIIYNYPTPEKQNDEIRVRLSHVISGFDIEWDLSGIFGLAKFIYEHPEDNFIYLRSY